MKVWISFGLACIGMIGLVQLLVNIGLQPFNIWGSIAIVVYAILAMSTVVSVIEDDVQ